MYPQPECGDCGRVFGSHRARQQHMDAVNHDVPDNECDTCARYFGSRAALAQHMNALGHWAEQSEAEIVCGFCDDVFGDEDELGEHEVEGHLYCHPCDRHFSNMNNIRQHLRSSTHQGTKLPCPFCEMKFVSATGVAHHLESGGCLRAPLDRDTVYRAIAGYDQRGQFTKKLIGWHGSATYEASDQAYNHYAGAWECYLCHKRFANRTPLDQHLNSPAHQQALYHCPNLRCRKDFGAVAALFNHLESESCGIMRFEEVQQKAQAMLDPARLIRF